MKVGELVEKMGLTVFNMVDEKDDIFSFCASDLFSYVMDKAKYKCCWLTIMSNVNITAVAKMAEISAVVLCDGVKPHQTLIKKAKEQNITLLGCNLPIFQASAKISQSL
ncbi:MAG: hypothetical protein IJV77_04900 [Clostridia bacterium]|nr:hypothetical protein [Clostridia bacterium]